MPATSRVVAVHYNDGGEQRFDAPAGWRLPVLMPDQQWLVIANGADELVVCLENVKYIATLDGEAAA